jgi:hypothetical protein
MEVKQPGGHIDQMIRQTRAHHVSLSSLADQKANMMLTIASLIVPLSIQFLYDPRTHLAAATMVSFCVLTIMLSAYAAMPKLNRRPSPGNVVDVNAPSFNPLFFGSFVQLDYPAYKQSMEALFNDHNELYESQIREIYALGRYLEDQKYRFVRWAYLSFICGVVLSSVIYVVKSYS